MKVSFKNLAIGGAIAAASLIGAVGVRAQQGVTFILSGKYMTTGSSAVVTVMDLNCGNRILGTFTLAGNQELSLTACSDGGGYAHVATRVGNNGDWHGSGMLRAGEPVYP